MTRLAGSHVVVTGGSLGIGLATARACADRGARVSIIGRDRERLSEAQRELGGDAVVAAADVTDPEAVHTAFGDLAALQGPCDVLLGRRGRQSPAISSTSNRGCSVGRWT